MMHGGTAVVAVMLVAACQPPHSMSCHTTKLLLQNGKTFDSRGWSRNEYWDISYWMTTTTTTTTKKPSRAPKRESLCIVPNRMQDCICGGFDVRAQLSLTNADRPWAAKLKFVTPSKDTYVCSGSLINRLFVLTAASCVVPKMGSKEKLTAGLNSAQLRGNLTIDVGYKEKSDAPLLSDLTAKKVVVKTGDGFNLALVELSKPVDFSKGGVSPICLPPPDDDSFEDLDCFQTDPENPFPVVHSDKPTLICRSTAGSHSSITAFGDVNLFDPSQWIPTCKTNPYGKSVGKACASTCSHSSNYTQDAECNDEEVQKQFSLRKFFNIQKVITQSGNECFPKINETAIKASMHEIDISTYGFGWCATCEKVNDDGTCTGKDQGWGFCEPKCDFGQYVNNRFRKAQGSGLHEIAFESYESNPNDKHCTAVAGKEFCSGLSHPPIHTWKNRSAIATPPPKPGRRKRQVPLAKMRKSQMRSMAEGGLVDIEYVGVDRSTSEGGDDGDGPLNCHGDTGGSVWKNHTFENSFEESLPLAVLTGVVSRHAERCNMFERDADNVQVSMHTRILYKDTLDWILSQSQSGKCGDLQKHKCI